MDRDAIVGLMFPDVSVLNWVDAAGPGVLRGDVLPGLDAPCGTSEVLRGLDCANSVSGFVRTEDDMLLLTVPCLFLWIC